jgi:hypothetical protein
MKAKTRKPTQRYGIINNGAASKFGRTLETSQGPITFEKDLMACKNEEQMNELTERYKGFVYPVSGERPTEPGSRVVFTMPELPWKKVNRMSRQEREDEERQRQEAASGERWEIQGFDQ